jgi:adenylate kinase family enzyme
MDGPISLEELHDKVKGLMPNRPKVCIGIDGMDGVGKTRLAQNLATRLGATVISLDDHVAKKRGMYVPYIRCQEVTAAIEAGSRLVVVEGVCLRAVAECCAFTIDVHIYVKRVSRDTGLWNDAELCLAETPVDDLKQHERELRRWGAVISGREDVERAEKETGLRDELVEYHARWRPVQSANVLFTIAE